MHIISEPEPLAAILAAEAYRTSTQNQFYRAAAIPAFQFRIFHPAELLYPIRIFFKTPGPAASFRKENYVIIKKLKTLMLTSHLTGQRAFIL